MFRNFADEMERQGHHQYEKEEITRKKNCYENCFCNSSFFRKLSEDNFVALEYESEVDLLDDAVFCSLEILGETIPIFYVEAIAMQKSIAFNAHNWTMENESIVDSPFKDMINKAVLEAYSDGTMMTLQEKWLKSGQRNCKVNKILDMRIEQKYFRYPHHNWRLKTLEESSLF